MERTAISIDDKYSLDDGRIFVTGSQALVRLPLLQRQRDLAAGLNTAGYISGYQGSPLGGYDQQLWKAKTWLETAHIQFSPAVNEDLAATAIWGTQQLHLIPGAKYDGVFSIWYGKGPGVDRSGDPLKHGNRAGTSRHGGVLVVFGDDHPAKSSTVAFQSEPALIASGIPSLYPATIQELIDFGLHGFAMSRFSGCWVGMKTINDTVEATATAQVATDRVVPVLPDDVVIPADGVHIRPGFNPVGEEARLYEFKLPLVQAYARANGLDKTVIQAPKPRLGIVAPGKSYLDVRQALATMGIDDARAMELGISLYKVGLVWPLEPEGLKAFARGHEELLFVEEKQPLIQDQAATILYGLAERPRLVGKLDHESRPLLAAHSTLDVTDIIGAITQRLETLGLTDGGLTARLDLLAKRNERVAAYGQAVAARIPYFCSGCPHNTSTKVPDGSMAMSGIGCHAMVMFMDRKTLTPTQMGGEGANWNGIAPFSETTHMFQNLGDGTYYHSGLLAIRAAVGAGVNITYKVLLNDAVAMTGGQPVLGAFSASDIAEQAIAEGVKKVAVVTDDPERHRGVPMPARTSVYHRDQLDKLQLQFRETPGTTMIVYEQTCAAEKRRRRKRNQFPDPPKRAFINELVCEGCGDCSEQANCVSILPKETEFGRKREIDQSNCNKDYSCVKGFCPSFVTVHGGQLRKPAAAELTDDTFVDLPEPVLPLIDGSYDVMITGIGGTGVVTIGAVLGMAAHVGGRGVSVFDITGMAQKNGAVYSHLRIAETPGTVATPKISAGECELLLACDMVAATAPESLHSLDTGRTVAVINSRYTPTANFQLDKDLDFHKTETLELLTDTVGPGQYHEFDASTLALKLLGNTIGSNMMVVGYAYQSGGLPLSAIAIEEAIALNGVSVEFNIKAFRLGRLAAQDPARLQALLPAEVISLPPEAHTPSLEQTLNKRVDFLIEYQNAAYAQEYKQLVEAVAKAEQERTHGLKGLAEAVAKSLFKLMAYKDEYEVARLYVDGTFMRKLNEQFEGDFKLKFHLAPPLLSRPDPVTGKAKKLEFGGWILPLFRLLARLKGLRGTPLDIFGYTAERRMERRLRADYQSLLADLIGQLNDDNHAVAVALAKLPESIRGYGHVKQRNAEQVLQQQDELLRAFGNPVHKEVA